MKPRILFFLIFFLALSVINFGAIYSYGSLESNILEERVLEHLRTTAQSRANHIEDFISEHKSQVLIAATHQELSNEELREIKKISGSFYEIFVLDSNGKIITSSEESHIGEDKSGDDYFVNVIKEGYVKNAYYSETTKFYFIAISVPQGENILVAKIKLDLLDEITRDRNGLGETGEVYFINKEGYMLSSSRFKEGVILREKVDGQGARQCFEPHGQEEYHKAIEYKDYRDISVYGVYYKINEFDWCVLVEIDKAEIQGKIRGDNCFELLITSLVVSLGGVISGTLFWIFVLKGKRKKK